MVEADKNQNESASAPASIPMSAQAPSRWPDPKWIVLLVLVVMTAIPLVKIIQRPRGDFGNHWEFGRRLVAGEDLYALGLNVPYPPFWAMMHAPWTVMPVASAQLAFLAVGFASLVGLVSIVKSLDRGRLRTWAEWSMLAVLLLAARYIVRDLDEAGPNIMLVCLSWLGIWLWSRGRDALGGLSLGTAIALKCTAGIFVLFFLWKRQWRMAAGSLVVAGLLTLAPALMMGVDSYRSHMEHWLHFVRLGSGSADPSTGVLGDEPVANKSLRPALARFLMTLPEGHLARYDHPAYLDFADLTPAAASRVVQFVTLGVLALFAWTTAGPVRDRRDLRLVHEFAAVGVLGLLLSPITWGHHCVAIVPALYLVVARILSGPATPWPVKVTFTAFVAVTVLVNRLTLGTERSLVAESYHPVTWSLALLLVMVLLVRPAYREEQAVRIAEPVRRAA